MTDDFWFYLDNWNRPPQWHCQTRFWSGDVAANKSSVEEIFPCILGCWWEHRPPPKSPAPRGHLGQASICHKTAFFGRKGLLTPASKSVCSTQPECRSATVWSENGCTVLSWSWLPLGPRLQCRHEIRAGYGIKRSEHMSGGTGAFLMSKEARSGKREVNYQLSWFNAELLDLQEQVQFSDAEWAECLHLLQEQGCLKARNCFFPEQGYQPSLKELEIHPS